MAMPKTFGFTAYRRKQALNPDRSLERLSIILFFFHRFLFIFRLLVGI